MKVIDELQAVKKKSEDDEGHKQIMIDEITKTEDSLAGMDKAIEGELKVGKYKDSYDIKLNGNNYNFYPLELHPKMLADVNSQNLDGQVYLLNIHEFTIVYYL